MRLPEGRPCSSPARQRGAIIIAAAAAIGVCLALMASADVGYLFYMKREFQKSADLAALAGAQRLAADCTQATAAANANVVSNLANHSFTERPTVTVSCGIWSPTGPAAPANSTAGPYFNAGGAAAALNSVHVLIAGNAPRLMPFIANRQIRATAVATRSQATAVISTGSSLANLRLGGINTAVLGADGLARITLAGLLGRLGISVNADIGIGELNALLSAKTVTIGQLIDASVVALPATTGAALSAQLGVLKQSVVANSALKDINIKLGGADSLLGLVASTGVPSTQDSASQARTALHTELKVSDLVSTAIGIATAKSAVAVPSLNVAGVTVQASIVSPPTMASGLVGTTARQAQVRLFMDIDTDKIPLIGLVTASLGVRVHLPLFIDLVRGTARINAISCGSSPPTVDIGVTQSVVGACVGKVADPLRFSAIGLCDAATPADLQPEVLLKLLGKDTLTTSMRIDALTGTQTMPGVRAGETRTIHNNLPIGDALTNITSVLTSTLAKLGNPPTAAAVTDAKLAADTANLYLAQTPMVGGRYQLEDLIKLLENGKATVNLPALGTWTSNAKGEKFSVPYSCNVVLTCYANGSVWESFRATVTGAGGLLSTVLGSVLGGLAVNKCDNLLSGLGLADSYNKCVASNLASYLQSKPGGVVQPPTTGPCNTLLCATLAPVTAAVAPLLNTIGSTLSATLASTLGLTLGDTSVTVHDISCGNVRLVH